jgi:N-methylhydantoinase B
MLKGEAQLAANDCVRVFTAGGGGYGDPLRRSLEAVEADVRDGYVSAAAARSEYGVMLDNNFSADYEATATLRSTRSLADAQ